MNSKDRQKLEYKVDNLNIDLRLVRQLNKQIPEEKICIPKSLKNLGKLLSQRNLNYKYTIEEKQKSQEWARMKGTDIKILNDKIKILKELKDQKKLQKKIQEDCYFYFPQINLSNQDQYINKLLEFSVFSLVQTAMYNPNIRKDFTRKIISKLRRGTGYKSSHLGVPTANVRSKQKKMNYHQKIMNLMEQIKPLESINFIQKFKIVGRNKCWQIMQRHLRQLKQNHQFIPQQLLLLLTSLKMVEQQYDKVLPRDQESLLHYLSQTYLNKLVKQNNISRNQLSKDNFWGIAYLMYQSDRKNDFYQMLIQRNLDEILGAFRQSDQSIRKSKPRISTRLSFTYYSDDIFFKQLIFVLKGSPKYSSAVLCDPEKIDFVWILLRTVGILIQDKDSYDKFYQLRKDLFQKYLGPNINAQKIINMFYLLGYPEIAEMGPTDCIDLDDYLHMLIVMVYNPVLIRNHQPRIRKILTEKLSSYINEIILQKKSQDEYLCYLALIPVQDLPRQGSLIIASSELLQGFNWKYFQRRLKPNIYQALIKQTLENYILIHKNYKLVAQKYIELLNDKKSALQILFVMLIKSITQIKISNSQIVLSQEKLESILNTDNNLRKQYNHLLSILIETRKMNQYLNGRNVANILSMVQKTQFIIIQGRINGSLRTVFDQLLRRNSLEVYFYYLQAVVRGLEIALYRENTSKIALSTLNSIQISLEDMLREQQSRPYINKQIVQNLRRHLNSALWNIKQ